MNHYDRQYFKGAVLGTESRHTEHCDVEYNEDLDAYMLFKDGELVGEAEVLNGKVYITTLK